MKRPLLVFQLLLLLLVYSRLKGGLFLAILFFLVIALFLQLGVKKTLLLLCTCLLMLPWFTFRQKDHRLYGRVTQPSLFEERYRVGSALLEGDFHRYLGQRVVVRGQAKEPRAARNPGVFDYPVYLSSVGITGIFEKVQVVEEKSDFLTVLIRWRKGRLEAIWTNLSRHFDQRSAAALYGLLTGDTKGFSERALETMRKSQLGHLFAVSGLHVGILYGLIRRASLGHRVGGSVLSIFLLGLYAFFVGPSVSFYRALGLVLLAEVCFYFKRPFDLLSGLSLMGMIVLLLSPLTILQVSYQYSFGALLSIGLVDRWLGKRKLKALTTMGALGLMTFAVGSVHFVGYSIGGFLLNPFLIPLLPLVMILLLAVVFLGGRLAFLNGLLKELVAYLFFIMDHGARAFRAVPAPQPPLVATGLLLLLLATVTLESEMFFSKKKGFLLCILSLFFLLWPRPVLRVETFDMGHGDALLIAEKGGQILLVDTGSRWSVDDIGPLLLRQGIDRIDHLILTHAHEDHYGGLGSLLSSQIFVERVYLSRQTLYNEQVMMRLIGLRPMTMTVVDGPYWMEGPKGKVFLTAWPGAQSPNDASLVMRYEGEGFSILTTGDLTREAEEHLGSQPLGPVDVLKVAHHGSNTSSSATFLAPLGARVALIPASGRYGLPDERVIQRLRHFDMTPLVTGERGAIRIRHWGDTFTLSTVLEED